MAIRVREVDSANILDIDGQIDVNSSDLIETVGWLTTTGKVNIVLNLENVGLVDYSGLSALAIAYKNVSNHKGKMKFVHVPLSVIVLFKVVKLESIFEVYPDEESAVKSFYADEVQNLHLRRKFMRLDIHVGVKYRLASDQKEPKISEGQALNISAAGAYIYSSHTFPINSRLELEFSLPDKRATLEASGRVVWMADKEIQQHYYPGMGVAFIHLSPEKERAIIDFIDKNITHRAEPS